MNEHIREQIRRAFEDEYQAPAMDLRQMLWASGRRQRRRVRMPVRLGAAVAVTALVAVGVVVALWVLSAIAHLILGALTAVVVVVLIVGAVWLFAGRGRRRRS